MDEEPLVRDSPPGSGTRTPRAHSRPCPAPPRSRRGTATARPTAARRDEVRARDEHGVVRRRPGRKLGGTRKERAGPYCIDPSSASVVVAVDRAPRPPLVLGPLDPRPSPASRSPRDCHQTHVWHTDGAVSSVAPVSPATRGVIASQAARRRARRRRRRTGRHVRHRSRYSATRCLHLARRRSAARLPTRARGGRSIVDRPSSRVDRDLGRTRAGERETPLDLERGIGRVGGEHVVRDDRMAFHYGRIVEPARSPRAARRSRNGTNVVPRPGGDVERRSPPYA